MRLQEARARIMRLSRYLLPTLKETPAEAQIVSHRYMLPAGMIRQTSAGIYAWLPLAFRVLKKIERIVREERSEERRLGKSVSERADLGGRRSLKKKNKY